MILCVSGNVGRLGLGGRRIGRSRGREISVGPSDLGSQHCVVIAVRLSCINPFAGSGLLVHAGSHSAQFAVSLALEVEKLSFQWLLASSTHKAPGMVAQSIRRHALSI